MNVDVFFTQKKTNIPVKYYLHLHKVTNSRYLDFTVPFWGNTKYPCPKENANIRQWWYIFFAIPSK